MKLIVTTIIAAFGMLLVSFSSPTTASKLDGGEKFSIFLVPGIVDQASAEKLNNLILSQPGTNVSRTDHLSKKVFIIHEADALIAESTFREWFEGWGYEIKCYSDGMMGIDAINHPTMDSCDE